MKQLDAGGIGEQFRPQMDGAAHAGGCIGHPAGLGLGRGDVLLDGSGREMDAHGEHIRRRGHQGDRREIA